LFSKGKAEDGVNLFFDSIQKMMPYGNNMYENKIGKNRVKRGNDYFVNIGILIFKKPNKGAWYVD
jgi:hypothetical protein